jgi:hypothetical protein
MPVQPEIGDQPQAIGDPLRRVHSLTLLDSVAPAATTAVESSSSASNMKRSGRLGSFR